MKKPKKKRKVRELEVEPWDEYKPTTRNTRATRDARKKKGARSPPGSKKRLIINHKKGSKNKLENYEISFENYFNPHKEKKTGGTKRSQEVDQMNSKLKLMIKRNAGQD